MDWLRKISKLVSVVTSNKNPQYEFELSEISDIKIVAEYCFVLWQPLDTKSNDYTSGKSLSIDIKWKVHKRTWQEVSAKLESYIYKIHMVCATNNYTCPYVHATTSCLPHSLLKTTMLYTCTLTSSSRSFLCQDWRRWT